MIEIKLGLFIKDTDIMNREYFLVRVVGSFYE